MNDILLTVLINLEKVGIGVSLFLCAYAANMGLGAWKSVKIEGYSFDWHRITNSAIKFTVLGGCLALLTVAVSLIPYYVSYAGVEIESEALKMLDSVVIIGAFLTAAIRYVKDAIDKLADILGNS